VLSTHPRTTIAAFVLVPLALVLAVQKLIATSGSLCPEQFGSFSVGHWPPACWRPYGPRSPFNTPIPADPRLAADSRRIVAFILAHRWSFEGSGGRPTIDAGGSRPVYWAQPSDPLVRVRCREEHSCQHVRSVRFPRRARAETESDGHLTIVEQATAREYDFWQAGVPSRGVLRTSAASVIPIGANAGTGLEGDAEAAHLGLLGGLVRAPELVAGRIEHALAMVAPCVQARDVYPAPAWGRGDAICGAGGAGPHFGSLLQLNMSEAEISATGAPRWQRAIMTAMARYGAYVVDTGGASTGTLDLLKEEDQSFTSFGYAPQMQQFVASLGSGTVGVPIDFSKLRVISPCVPRHAC